MGLALNICPKFWKDIKRTKSQALKFIDNGSNISELDDSKKIESCPVVQSIINLINNSITSNILDSQSDKYFRQPFLNEGWTIRKMRWAIDKKGKSNGLRVIFAISETELLMVLIATKNECDDERKLEKEIVARIEDYICI